MKKKLCIAVILCILILVAFVGFFIYQDNQKKQVLESMTLTFKEEHPVIEYGSKVDAASFIKKEEGDIEIYPDVDSKLIGTQKLTYVLYKSGYEKEIDYTIEVKDTKKPVIKLKSASLILTEGEAFVAKDIVQSVQDPVDGALSYKKKLELGSYIISSNVNTKKDGTYQITVSARDRNGLQAKAVCKVTVKKAEVVSSNTNTEKNPSQVVEPTYINGILLVNKTYGLPRSFGGLDPTAYSALQNLQNATANVGYSMPLLSGYRSYDTQVSLYNDYVARDGQELADTYSARPGHSEHQSGLCFDVGNIDNDYGSTAAGQWLEKNCASYGFIIRFPQGKEAITGYQYEPWHIRYVGRDPAIAIMNSGLCLEEYLQVN